MSFTGPGYTVRSTLQDRPAAVSAPADIDALGGRVPAVHVEQREVEARHLIHSHLHQHAAHLPKSQMLFKPGFLEQGFLRVHFAGYRSSNVSSAAVRHADRCSCR